MVPGRTISDYTVEESGDGKKGGEGEMFTVIRKEEGELFTRRIFELPT